MEALARPLSVGLQNIPRTGRTVNTSFRAPATRSYTPLSIGIRLDAMQRLTLLWRPRAIPLTHPRRLAPRGGIHFLPARTFTIAFECAFARSFAVLPSSSLMVWSTPFCTSIWTHRSWPRDRAQCSGVEPLLLCRLYRDSLLNASWCCSRSRARHSAAPSLSAQSVAQCKAAKKNERREACEELEHGNWCGRVCERAHGDAARAGGPRGEARHLNACSYQFASRWHWLSAGSQRSHDGPPPERDGGLFAPALLWHSSRRQNLWHSAARTRPPGWRVCVSLAMRTRWAHMKCEQTHGDRENSCSCWDVQCRGRCSALTAVGRHGSDVRNRRNKRTKRRPPQWRQVPQTAASRGGVRGGSLEAAL